MRRVVFQHCHLGIQTLRAALRTAAVQRLLWSKPMVLCAVKLLNFQWFLMQWDFSAVAVAVAVCSGSGSGISLAVPNCAVTKLEAKLSIPRFSIIVHSFTLLRVNHCCWGFIILQMQLILHSYFQSYVNFTIFWVTINLWNCSVSTYASFLDDNYFLSHYQIQNGTDHTWK